MKKEILVLLDTGSLMAPFQTGLDLMRLAEELLPGKIVYLVTENTLGELKRLSKSRKLSVKRAALAAMQTAEKVEVIRCREKRADDAILEAAEEHNFIVVTTDSELRKRLRRRGVAVIFPRKGKRASVEGTPLVV